MLRSNKKQQDYCKNEYPQCFEELKDESYVNAKAYDKELKEAVIEARNTMLTDMFKNQYN